MNGNYKKDIKIDENALEAEWLEQPSYYLYYAEAHADAFHERDMCKSRMDKIYSDLYAYIKTNWEKHFDKQPTEPAIKEYIIGHDTYQESQKKLVDAARNANLMLGVKTAFDHRRRALENLVSLRISGFHSEPRKKKRVVRKGAHKAQKQSLNTKK